MMIDAICFILFSFGIIIIIFTWTADNRNMMNNEELNLGFNLSHFFLILSTAIKVLTL